MDDFDLAVSTYRRRKPRDHDPMGWWWALLVTIILLLAVFLLFVPDTALRWG